ncbi:hypothetical protein [Streptomyces sp. JJ36]|uniref:hypothetical protein n=1 Tax=Streptomyces sp. JJ36 TaxID=2736645 RepID=UPI001F43A319|nr:hypothetical protein [Streptomyces sp. JJ36]MCF6523389.1 hypothetical protein [Streptomyces sp. JJ36]
MTLLLAATACSSDGKEAAAGEAEACEGLLGAGGIEWIKKSTQQDTTLGSDGSIQSARSRFQKYARVWDPKSEEVPLFSSTEVCRVLVQDQTPRKNYLTIRYGASIFPFDFPFEREIGMEAGRTVIPVNSEVKLVHYKERQGVATQYHIYVKCKVSDSPEGQEREVPLQGVMEDTLTGDTSDEVHLKYLLHSTRVLVRDFGCQNRPSVPEEVTGH